MSSQPKKGSESFLDTVGEGVETARLINSRNARLWGSNAFQMVKSEVSSSSILRHRLQPLRQTQRFHEMPHCMDFMLHSFKMRSENRDQLHLHEHS